MTEHVVTDLWLIFQVYGTIWSVIKSNIIIHSTALLFIINWSNNIVEYAQLSILIFQEAVF